MRLWTQIWDYCSRRKTRFAHDRKHWRDGDFFKGSADLFTVLGATKRFIKKDVPALLDLPAGTPVRIELPVSGSQSFTVILTAAEKKAILRVYPPVKAHTAKSHLNGAELLASCGVNVPRVIYSSFKTKKYPVIFILEEFITGNMKHAADLTDGDIQALAVQLAHMHSAHSSRWGRVMSERSEPFFPSLFQRVKRDLQTLQQKAVLDQHLADAVMAWVTKWEPAFNSYMKFSLTHNDLQPANGIFTPQGDYYLVDLNRLQWGPAAREVVRCYHRQLRLDPEKIELFNKTYYNELPSADAIAIAEFTRFYEVFHRVSTLVKMDLKADKIPELQDRNEQRQEVMLADLSKLIQQDGPNLQKLSASQ